MIINTLEVENVSFCWIASGQLICDTEILTTFLKMHLTDQRMFWIQQSQFLSQIFHFIFLQIMDGVKIVNKLCEQRMWQIECTRIVTPPSYYFKVIDITFSRSTPYFDFERCSFHSLSSLLMNASLGLRTLDARVYFWWYEVGIIGVNSICNGLSTPILRDDRRRYECAIILSKLIRSLFFWKRLRRRTKFNTTSFDKH